jgi:serine/threonine-protein kinase
MSDAWKTLLGDLVAPGQVVGGKYRIDRLVGAGGMAVVLEAWHLDLEERVAVKLLNAQHARDEEALARFEREARAAFKIKSEHVVRVLDVGRLENRTPYIVMEFLEGVDLATRLEKGTLFGVQEALDYVLEACEAVQEAHSLGIVHRDLKPENLFLARRPDGGELCKVLDFGVSKMAARSSKRQRQLTGATAALGTPHYMAPEQWVSASDAGPGADVWALGVITFELLCGVPPFDEPSVARLCTKVLKIDPPPMATFRQGLPPKIEQAVRRCLAKSPRDRYATIAELCEAFAPFAGERGQASAAVVARAAMRISRELSPALPLPGQGHPTPPLAMPAVNDFDAPQTRRMMPEEEGPSGDLVVARTPRHEHTQQSWQSGRRDLTRRPGLLVALGAVLVLAVGTTVVVLQSGASQPEATAPRAPEPSGERVPAAPAEEQPASETTSAPQTGEPRTEASATPSAAPSATSSASRGRPSRPGKSGASGTSGTSGKGSSKPKDPPPAHTNIMDVF